MNDKQYWDRILDKIEKYIKNLLDDEKEKYLVVTLELETGFTSIVCNIEQTRAVSILRQLADSIEEME